MAQIGKTKVFLRAGQMAELDTRRSEILGKSASIIQRKVRSYLARQSFISLRLSALQIQAACRGLCSLLLKMLAHIMELGNNLDCWCLMSCFVLIAGQLARQVFEGLRREASSLLIQRCFRMHIAKKAYKELYASAVSIQTGMRVMAAQCELYSRRRTSAAIIIQVGCILKSYH